MDLPPELRNMVYELVLVQDQAISFGNKSPLPSDSPAINTEPTHHLKSLLALTQVSRQLRDETTPVLFGRNTFQVLLSTKRHDGPLTQFKRQLRSVESPVLFDLDSAETPPGHLTYGDQNAALWATIARKEALMHIRQLSVDVELAESIPRWSRMQHLYATPSEPTAGGRSFPHEWYLAPRERNTDNFSPYEWYTHAIAPRCIPYQSTTWRIDYEERSLQHASIRKTGVPWDRRTPLNCGGCHDSLWRWGNDYIKSGDILTREHFLRLIWSV